jgi:hypothetical protein
MNKSEQTPAYLSVAIIGDGTSMGTGVFDAKTGEMFRLVQFVSINICVGEQSSVDITILDEPNNPDARHLDIPQVPIRYMHIDNNINVKEFQDDPQKVLDAVQFNTEDLFNKCFICSACNGTGQYHGLQMVDMCQECGGKGTIA